MQRIMEYIIRGSQTHTHLQALLLKLLLLLLLLLQFVLLRERLSRCL